MIYRWVIKQFGSCSWCKHGPESFIGGHVMIQTSGKPWMKFHYACFQSYFKYHDGWLLNDSHE